MHFLVVLNSLYNHRQLYHVPRIFIEYLSKRCLISLCDNLYLISSVLPIEFGCSVLSFYSLCLCSFRKSSTKGKRGPGSKVKNRVFKGKNKKTANSSKRGGRSRKGK